MFVSAGACGAGMHSLSAFEQCISVIFSYDFKTFLNFLVTKSCFSWLSLASIFTEACWFASVDFRKYSLSH